jgi:aspartate kinase
LEQLNSELERTVEGIAHLRELTSRSRDYLLSFGERLSTSILAAALSAVGLRTQALTGAEAGIATDDNFGEAKPLVEISYHQVQQRLDPLWSRRVIPVVAGFISATVDGSVTTLGRGGSDYTATLLAAALGADEIWIWTDVDGLMTADPRIVKDARVLPSVSFGEALELSYFGAKMMHPRALQPASQKKIPVRIKSSSKPTREGTIVSTKESPNGGRVVKAVSIIRDVGIVSVSGTGMMGAPGVAAKVFQTLGSNNVNVMMISQGSSEATISCVVARKDVDLGVRALQLALLGQGHVERILEEKDTCVIAVVGSGMKGTPGVAARVFGAVAKKEVNVRMVAQGSSEYNISFVVSEKDGPEAVRAIHKEFRLGTTSS